MIVEKVERKVVASVDMERRRFRIDESGLVNILSILRKNMYSNPTRIIVQEYANNARDAHTFAKINERPIQITCPTDLNPYLKIRDFGPGISPQDIDDVFIAYGASTKRHTNDMIGGFGIGAKSAFSYCDAFEVTTIHEGVKYTYYPHIDESDIGEMPLIAVENTDEESGTLISIPIKDSDIYRVNSAIVLVTEYWDIRPELIGSLNYSNRKVYFSEFNWSLMEKSHDYKNNEIVYCVEGIPYTFKIPSEDERFSAELKELANCPFVVKLRTGDVTISSNREALVSDEKTLNKVHEILSEINNHFKSHVMESIEKCDTLTEMFEMRRMYNRLRLDHMIKSFEWKGINITGNHLRIPAEIGVVHSMRVHKRGNVEARGYSVKSTATGENINFSEEVNRHIFVTHVEEGQSYNKTQLLNAMMLNDTILNAQLIVLRVPEDDPVLNTIGFQYFNKVSLSEFPKKNIWKVKRFGAASKRVEYYTFNKPSSNEKNSWDRTQGDIGDIEEGVYFPVIRGVTGFGQEFFKMFQTICNLPIYGMPSRSIEEAEENLNLISYKVYLEIYCEKLLKYLNENEDDAGRVYGSSNHTFKDCFQNIKKILNHLSPDHYLAKWNHFGKYLTDPAYNELKKVMQRYNYFITYIDGKRFIPKDSLRMMYQTAIDTYPMLNVYKGSESNYSGSEEQYISDIVDYINNVDRKIALSFEN